MRLSFPKWSSFFYCLRLKKVRSSLTEKRNTAGSLDTVTGQNKRQKPHESRILFFWVCAAKILNFKIVWGLQNFTASYCYTVTLVNVCSAMTTANRIIKYLPFQQQLMRHHTSSLTDCNKESWDLSAHLQRTSKWLCWLEFPYNCITVEVHNTELYKDQAKQCLLQPLYLLLSGFS